MNFNMAHPADQLVEIMNRIYRQGMTTTSGGNLSIRDENGDIWITPSGIDKGNLTRDDIMQVKSDGSWIGRHRPSVELPIHTYIYRARPDLNGIVHAHPPALVAFSVARRAPDSRISAEAARMCGDVAVVGYNPPGAEALGRDVAEKFAGGCNTVLMVNHGIVCGAKDFHSAFLAFETMNTAAQTQINAMKLGMPRSLSDGEIERALRAEALPGLRGERAISGEERAARRDLCALALRCYRQRLFTGAEGEISLRLSDGAMLMTPRLKDRMELAPEDIVYIREGCAETGKVPGRFWEVHRAIYEQHSDVRAVITARPPAIMGYACCGAAFDSHLVSEGYICLGDVNRLEWADGAVDARRVAGMIQPRRPVVLADSCCAVATGASLINAFDRLEVLECGASAVLAARDLGGATSLSEDEIDMTIRALHL